MSTGLAVAFLAVSAFFVWRSFYGMRIKETGEHVSPVAGVSGGHKTD